MRVIAVDPATGRASTMYDGREFRPVKPGEMRAELRRFKAPVLLCWNAPLTGPRSLAKAGEIKGDFTRRPIETFFSREETGFPTPVGIAVLPYAQRPEWTISRCVLGLPRVGLWDRTFDCLPFHLLPESKQDHSGPGVSKQDRRRVVEIHPAVAAWLWCREELSSRKTWRYQGTERDPGLRQEMWEIIVRQCDDELRRAMPEPQDDDQFDALVGYLLGVRWLRGDEVILLGDRRSGALLLPRVPGLEAAWARFQAGFQKK